MMLCRAAVSEKKNNKKAVVTASELFSYFVATAIDHARALRRDASPRTRAARRPRGTGRELNPASTSTCPPPPPSSSADFFPTPLQFLILVAVERLGSAAVFQWPEHHPRCEHTPGPCTALMRPTSHALCALSTASFASRLYTGSCSAPPPQAAWPSAAAADAMVVRTPARGVRGRYWDRIDAIPLAGSPPCPLPASLRCRGRVDRVRTLCAWESKSVTAVLTA